MYEYNRLRHKMLPPRIKFSKRRANALGVKSVNNYIGIYRKQDETNLPEKTKNLNST